jgi:hypothetical protein
VRDHFARRLAHRTQHYSGATDPDEGSRSQGPSSKPDIKPRTYEFIIAIKNYRPRLEFIDVYPEDPRTLERLKVLQTN